MTQQEADGSDMGADCKMMICCDVHVWLFQKISILAAQRELAISKGWSGQRLRKFRRGVEMSIYFPDVLQFHTDSHIDLAVKKSFPTYLADLSHGKIVACEYLYILYLNRIIFEIYYM